LLTRVWGIIQGLPAANRYKVLIKIWFFLLRIFLLFAYVSQRGLKMSWVLVGRGLKVPRCPGGSHTHTSLRVL